MFRKFLRSKIKKSKIVEKPEKPEKSSKKNQKEIKQKPKEAKEVLVPQYSANRFLTAEGWLRRQKKSI